MDIVRATTGRSGQIAYFCPQCGELIRLNSNDIGTPHMATPAKHFNWRAIITSCQGSPDEEPYILLWRID